MGLYPNVGTGTIDGNYLQASGLLQPALHVVEVGPPIGHRERRPEFDLLRLQCIQDQAFVSLLPVRGVRLTSQLTTPTNPNHLTNQPTNQSTDQPPTGTVLLFAPEMIMLNAGSAQH